jgi:hypothetical protein
LRLLLECVTGNAQPPPLYLRTLERSVIMLLLLRVIPELSLCCHAEHNECICCCLIFIQLFLLIF